MINVHNALEDSMEEYMYKNNLQKVFVFYHKYDELPFATSLIF